MNALFKALAHPVRRRIVAMLRDGPMSSGDIKYFNSLETGLNSVLKSQAVAHGATFGDTFASSIGHDACKAPGTAWVNGIIPTSAAFSKKLEKS